VPGARVIRLGDADVVAEPANALFLRSLVTAEEFGPDVSVTWVQIAGRHRRLRSERSVRVYAVLTGVLTFQVGDEEPVRVSSGELIVISRAAPYELAGTGSYLVVNAPAFAEGDDVYLDTGPPEQEGTT
jgi:mannose-6-phosphate isomerase-like protein (cupin superfamily)